MTWAAAADPEAQWDLRLWGWDPRPPHDSEAETCLSPSDSQAPDAHLGF